jgi:hypothetical protein
MPVAYGWNLTAGKTELQAMFNSVEVLGLTAAGVAVTGTLSSSGAVTISAGGLNVLDAVNIEFGTGLDAVLRWSTGDADNHSFVIGLGDSNQALHITDKGAVATDWNVAADTHPTVYIHSNTTPATDYLAIGGHDGTNAFLNMVGGTGLDIRIDSVGALRIDDAAVASFAAAGDTAGKSVFIETQDGGTASGNNNGVAGGALSIKTGDGTAPAGTGTTGGAGGAWTIATGAGAAGSATGTGGAGGTLTISTGAGGNVSGAGTSGAGGDIVLSPGAGGTHVGGTAGRTGVVNVADGKILYVGVVAMPGTTVGANWIGLEDSGTDPTGTLTNSLALYTPDAGDSLDFLHADGTTDSLGT